MPDQISQDNSVTSVTTNRHLRAVEVRRVVGVGASQAAGKIVFLRRNVTDADGVEIGQAELTPIEKTYSDISANTVTLTDTTVLSWAQIDEALQRFATLYS